jgi:hypothetical protein
LPVGDLAGTVGVDDIDSVHIVGQIGPLRLRFVRDRGQDWLEVGPRDSQPPLFFSFCDVQIALGWKTVSEALDMKDVEPLGDVRSRVAQRWEEITRTLSGDATSPGWNGVAEAAKARGEAFLARLRQPAPRDG